MLECFSTSTHQNQYKYETIMINVLVVWVCFITSTYRIPFISFVCIMHWTGSFPCLNRFCRSLNQTQNNWRSIIVLNSSNYKYTNVKFLGPVIFLHFLLLLMEHHHYFAFFLNYTRGLDKMVLRLPEYRQSISGKYIGRQRCLRKLSEMDCQWLLEISCLWIWSNFFLLKWIILIR